MSTQGEKKIDAISKIDAKELERSREEVLSLIGEKKSAKEGGQSYRIDGEASSAWQRDYVGTVEKSTKNEESAAAVSGNKEPDKDDSRSFLDGIKKLSSEPKIDFKQELELQARSQAKLDEEKDRIEKEKIALERSVREKEAQRQSDLAKSQELAAEKNRLEQAAKQKQAENEAKELEIARKKAELEELRKKHEAEDELEKSRLESRRQKEMKKKEKHAKLIEEEDKRKMVLQEEERRLRKMERAAEKKKSWMKRRRRWQKLRDDLSFAYFDLKRLAKIWLKALSRYAAYFSILAVLAYLALAIALLRFNYDHPYARMIARYLPVPAMRIKGEYVQFYEYLDTKKQISGKYQSGIDEAAKFELIREVILNDVGDRYNLYRANISQLESYLGNKVYFDRIINQVPMNRIENIRKLISFGNAFTDTAKLGDSSGELWFATEEAAAEKFTAKVSEIEIDQLSSVIVADGGYYIIKKGLANGQIRIDYIFVKGYSLEEYILKEYQNVDVRSFVK